MAEVTACSLVGFNTSVSLKGVTRCAYNPGVRASRVQADGYQSPHRLYINAVDPVVEFTTLDVATAVALGTNTFLLNGLALSAAFSGYLTQRTADAGRGASGDKVSIAAGMIVPVRLSARDMEPAELSCRVLGRSADGTTNPMSVTADQTLPAFAALGDCHTVGKVTINGSALSLVDSIEVEPNIDVGIIHGDGYLYPMRLYVRQNAPRIVITTRDSDTLNTLGIAGVAQGATDSVVSFRKFDPNGGRVADATAAHILLTVDDGRIWTESVEANQDAAAVRVIIEPVWDGTAAIVVTSVAAIT